MLGLAMLSKAVEDNELLTVVHQDSIKDLNTSTDTSTSETIKKEMINSFILAGLAFFSTITVTGDLELSLKISGINAGVAFFTRLATARGLRH